MAACVALFDFGPAWACPREMQKLSAAVARNPVHTWPQLCLYARRCTKDGAEGVVMHAGPPGGWPAALVASAHRVPKNREQIELYIFLGYWFDQKVDKMN